VKKGETADMPRRLTRSVIDSLDPYIPGRPIEDVEREYGLTDVIKMASNENPWGSSPMALEAMREELGRSNLYPEGSCRDLREALAGRLGVTPEMIVVSNGADNVLMMIAQAFVEKGEEVVMARPTFAIYRTAVLLMGGVPVEVPLRDFTHDLRGMAQAVGPRTKAVIVCNPNNPTGTMVGKRDLDSFLDRLPDHTLLILDEVYGDFAASPDYPDGLDLISGERPVISVRSFSKLYGLAGLRVGYAVSSPGLAEALNRVREPFPVNRLAQVAAKAALLDEGFRRHVLAETEKGKAFLGRALRDMGLRCLESSTNFLFVDLMRDAQGVFQELLRRGIIVRPGKIWGAPTWCRITIGTMEQNRRLVRALAEVLAEEGGED
jgi:histidinol-phosphate aminotransferase